MAYKDRQWCKEHGICTKCKTKDAFNGGSLCADCRYYDAEYYHNVRKLQPNYKEKAQEYMRKRVATTKAKGLCRTCGKPVCERSTIYCDKHRQYQNAKAMESYYKNRGKKEGDGNEVY